MINRSFILKIRITIEESLISMTRQEEALSNKIQAENSLDISKTLLNSIQRISKKFWLK